MSKTSSEFAAFANAAENDKVGVKSNDRKLYSKYEQLTVGELISVLQRIVKRDPDARNTKISYIEMGSIVPSTTVEVCKDGVILSNYY